MSEHLERLKTAIADRYAIDREIGRGGMAVVYLAEDVKHGRQVAIKVLQPSLSATLGTDRFLREIETAARLNHPHILPLYDSGEADGFLYYVMPYVEGDSLRDRIDREGQLPVEEAVRLTREVAGGLAYAHSEGVIHRDIKPGNIMLSRGHAVIADFGIAQAVDEAGGERLTQTGISTGSPIYMSPEQARGSELLDSRTDIYSLGCVLYEMLAGEPPFTGGTQASITARKEMESAPSLGTLRDTVPEGVEGAVAKALAKVPADRFGTAEEFAGALTESRDIQITSRRPKRQSGIRSAIPVAVVVVFGLVGLMAVFQGRSGSQQEVDGLSTSATAAGLPVAVLPFTAVGTDTEADLWHEGIVHLLSGHIESVDGLRRVDPALVMRAWTEEFGEGGSAPDAQTALVFADRIGARYAVLGQALGSGSTLRLTAEVYNSERSQFSGSTHVQGPAHGDSIFGIVEQLAVAILREELLPADSVQLAGLSQVATRSLPAFNAYLEGERDYRRGRYEEAAAHFVHATELDTTFARAMFRASMAFSGAWEWTLSGEYRNRAISFADRVPSRDSVLFVTSYSAAPEAIPLMESLTTRHPEDLDAWIQLAELYWHYGGKSLRPSNAFRRAIERAFELGDVYAEQYDHLIEDAFARRDRASVADLLDRYASLDPEGHPCLGFELAYDATWGDDQARTDAGVVLNSVETEDLRCGWTALAASAATMEEMERRDREVVRQPSDYAFWRMLQARIMRGQPAAAREILRLSEGVPDLEEWGARFAVQFHLTDYPDSVLAHHAAVLLAGQDPLSNVPYGSHNSPFWLGALAVEHGRWSEVEASAALLDSTADSLRSLDSSYAQETAAMAEALRHFALLERDEGVDLSAFAGAISRLRSIGFAREEAEYFLRYRIGLKLLDRGDLNEAERYFLSFYPFHWAHYVAAQYHLGRIYEGLGETDKAREHYHIFADWWEHADPELQPWVDEARAALGRLGPLDQ